MSLSWFQYCNFSEEEIENANKNVIIIKDKILQLTEKLEKIKELEKNKHFKNPNEEECKLEKIKLQSNINRLEMSKECIKYYYGLTILL